MAAGPADQDVSQDLVNRLEAFVQQWRGYQGTEMAGAQDFLRQLLHIYEVPYKPGKLFEQHPVRIEVQGQSDLFGTVTTARTTTERMDMYLPRICVWEMKGPGERDLQKHHPQLLGYWARMRTRYMVLCNFLEFWIYDTDDEGGQLAPKLRFSLEELPGRGDALLFLLGRVPDLEHRSERVTAQIASDLGQLVRSLIHASDEPDADRDRIAKFVLECVFAMFAEDAELIPPGLFTAAITKARQDGDLHAVWTLFDDFARKDPRDKANRAAPYINGALFDHAHPKLPLRAEQIDGLYQAAKNFDWHDVRPEVFGSIFEQALSPVERHELGAHYTRMEDIARVVWPTVVLPWRRRISALRTPKDAAAAIAAMRAYHVLDPACGCGNFLYVVYREMKRLEAALVAKWDMLQRRLAKRRSEIEPAPPRPYFSVQQLHGIEINAFAALLARVVLWIGEHLAKRELGLDEVTLPLKSLADTIRHGDALTQPWVRPEGELAIVSNPPYLGVRKLRAELGDAYVEKIFARYPDNRAADYVTYWFTGALATLRPGERAGYVATNSIAQNESREASLDRVLAAGATITDAWRSYPWPGDAAVHVSIVNWVMAPWEGARTLDGVEVAAIGASLVTGVDAAGARRIEANAGLCFMGVTPGNNEFVLDAEARAAILAEDPGSESVIKPFLVGRDVNREIDQRPTRWIIDFGTMEKAEAERFSGAFGYVRRHVYPVRKDNRREAYARRWWLFVEARGGLRKALATRRQALVIPSVSPHLTVSKQPTTTCFDHQLMVVALDSWYHFGLLQSRHHGLWARARGSTLKGDLRYTNTTVFETYPFPTLPDGSYAPATVPTSSAAAALAAAAERFDATRRAACLSLGVGLTKLHNAIEAEEPGPVFDAWQALNDAVDAVYGWPVGSWRDRDAVLGRLLALNAALAPMGGG